MWVWLYRNSRKKKNLSFYSTPVYNLPSSLLILSRDFFRTCSQTPTAFFLTAKCCFIVRYLIFLSSLLSGKFGCFQFPACINYSSCNICVPYPLIFVSVWTYQLDKMANRTPGCQGSLLLRAAPLSLGAQPLMKSGVGRIFCFLETKLSLSMHIVERKKETVF